MTHYNLSGGLPTAIITRKRNEMRSYYRNNENVVYLNDKDTFEIRLFNPCQTKVGVEIRINGQSTSDALLVLNPGQDVTLERYLDSNRKFMFETYHVDAKNPDAMKAIENNGLVEIFFYNEKQNNTWHIYNAGTFGCFADNTTNNYYGGTFTTTGGVDTGSLNVGSSGTPKYRSAKAKSKNKLFKSALETGRVGKGDKSNQRLEKVNVEFESFHFHNVEFKLLPASQRTERYQTQNVRNYCSSCSYRIRKDSWKYCPKCGNKLD